MLQNEWNSAVAGFNDRGFDRDSAQERNIHVRGGTFSTTDLE
uniref:Uncharacterized protein n=1 Tax=Candidatus Methanogaster sp. ANME-2c ERB4 TaxID=2759911 RepID=A0A7G9YBD2_9EURY|nr:hypothetical protein MMIICKHE_00004 [Methanosarcinales archaeon ANME-2c ERB4]